MELIYATEKLHKLCQSTSTATKFFGGKKILAIAWQPESMHCKML